MLRSDVLSPLLVFLPCSVAPYYFLKSFDSSSLDSYSTFLFVSSLLGLVPMASRLGWVTEQIAHHTNDTYSGLINATVGNASELIFCLVALEDKMYR